MFITHPKADLELPILHSIRQARDLCACTALKKIRSTRVSLWSFEVFDDSGSRLSDVHFIKLLLKDNAGKIISDNFYWRSKKGLDYKDINTLPAVELKVQSKTITSRRHMHYQRPYNESCIFEGGSIRCSYSGCQRRQRRTNSPSLYE